MKLQTLTRGQCQLVREWRNAEPQFLRTPYMITEKMQDDFYDNVINDRDSNHRYFAIIDKVEKGISEKRIAETKEDIPLEYIEMFVGMGGLTNIEWQNGCAEISLILDPWYRGHGKDEEAVQLILDEAFKSMRLVSVYGEVYACGNMGFWKKIVSIHDGYFTFLLDRKFYDGTMYDSMWFSVKGQ